MRDISGCASPTVEDRAVELQLALAERGRHRAASMPDLLIAATAELGDLTVLHLDKDFELIAELTGQPTERLALARTRACPHTLGEGCRCYTERRRYDHRSNVGRHRRDVPSSPTCPSRRRTHRVIRVAWPSDNGSLPVAWSLRRFTIE